MSEWLKETGCKPVGLCLRRFESCSPHLVVGVFSGLAVLRISRARSGCGGCGLGRPDLKILAAFAGARPPPGSRPDAPAPRYAAAAGPVSSVGRALPW